MLKESKECTRYGGSGNEEEERGKRKEKERMTRDVRQSDLSLHFELKKDEEGQCDEERRRAD